MANTTEHISLRLPADLVAELRAEAKREERSLAWVVAWRLRGTHRPSEADKTGTTSGSGNPPTVPAVRNAKSPKKRLHPVQPMRSELAGRGELGRQPEGGAVPEDAGNHEGHRIANQGRYCLTCRCVIA